MSDRISDLIKDAVADVHRAVPLEDAVWEALPEKTRERLGRVRLRQLIAIELNDPDQPRLCDLLKRSSTPS